MHDPQDIAILASITTLILAAVGWLNHRHSQMNRAFVYLMLALSALSIQNYFESGSTTLNEYIFWNRISNIYIPLLCILILYYVILLSGFGLRLQERIWGLSVLMFTRIVRLYLLLLIPLLLFTDVLIREFTVSGSGVFIVHYTGWMTVVQVIGLGILAYTTKLLVTAFRSAKSGSRRNLIRLNIIGVLIICTEIPFAPVILTMLGVELPALTTLTMIAVSLIFFLALNRYQVDKIQELNSTLENKVEERTRNLRETQIQFIQSEKMAAVGKLAAGIAHEANTPVGAVSASANVIERGVSRIELMLNRHQLSCAADCESELTKYLEIVRTNSQSVKSAGDRLCGLISNLRHFVRLDETGFQHADINDGLKITLDVLRSECRDRIHINYDYGELPAILCSPGNLNQAFMHLLQNSIEAIDSMGEITIGTRAEDGNIFVVISDTGRQTVAPEVDDIFDIGFSDTGRRVKSDMGLAIARHIIEDHKGTIAVERRSDSSLTFTVCLPVIKMETVAD